MKKILIILPVVAALFFASCKKLDGTIFTTADPNAKQHNDDVSDTKSESDNVNSDVNNALTNMSAFGKNQQIQAISICGATIDSSQQNATIPSITITFDGTTVCPNPNRIRSGSIKVELIAGTHWTDAGAQLRITHNNYKVVFTGLNNHYLTFNGIKYLTNVNGINWLTLYLGSSTATLKERSYHMQVTFDNGQSEYWSTARSSTWGINNYSEIYTIVNGDTSIGGQTVDSWGTTRFGTAFTTYMISPWKSNSTCGWWRPTSGQYTSKTTNFTITATFGVDVSGNTVSTHCAAYGFKLNWTLLPGNTGGTAIISYF